MLYSRISLVFKAGIMLSALLVTFSAAAQNAITHFETPEAAAESMVAALRTSDVQTMSDLMGDDYPLVLPVEKIDAENTNRFLAAWDEKHRIVDGDNNEKLIEVGNDGWTFPIPLAADEQGWHFDLQAGVEEVTARRIGRNELATMQSVLAYYDAQKDYAEKDRNNDGVLEYAQLFRSTEGNRDGLYWASEAGEEQSPLGPLFDSVNIPEGSPYNGYYFRILKGQGAGAPDGAYSYLLSGHMSSGFALIAWPAEYGESGIMSFMINHNGVIYEKNLGPDTAEIVKSICLFNPSADDGWVAVEPTVD